MDYPTKQAPRLTVDEVREALQVTNITDYVLFFGVMIGTSIMGLVYAHCTKGTGSAANEYLFAGDKIGVIPISMSLIASVISSIALLGTPALTYLFGINFFFVSISAVLSGVICQFILFPVLFELRLPSLYKYLYHRFDNKVRWLTSLCFILSQIFRMPIIIYLPSLVLQQAMGIDTIVISSVMSSVCILYTCIGGIRAVVWTDVIQTILMVASMLMIMVKGTYDSGGIQVLWDDAYNSSRLALPPLSIDLTADFTVLSLVLGGTIFTLSHAILNQNSMQRFNTLKTFKEVTGALVLYMVGYVIVTFLTVYNGLVAYSYYRNCDPITTGLARSKNEIIPILVMDAIGHFPGVPGLFFVGIFSAALSSLSTSLNSVPAIVLEDFIKPFKKTPMTDTMTLLVLKALVLLFGGIYLLLVFVVEKSSSAVVVLVVSLESITCAPLAGLFLAGIVLPFINSKGAFLGGLAGLVSTSIIVAGNQISMMNGDLAQPFKPLSADNCTYDFTIKPTVIPTSSPAEVFPLFKISFLWHSFIGFIVTLLVACAVSYLTGLNDVRKMDYKYFSPLVHRWLPKQNVPEEDGLLKQLKLRSEEFLNFEIKFAND